MTTDFTQVVKNKTKDELVRIVINKHEYKDELVEAASEELRLRDIEPIDSVKAPIDNSQTRNRPIQSKDTPFGIYLAGILLFITSPIWIFFSFFQAGISTIADSTAIGLNSIWNIFASVLSIVFGIGIIKGKKWGYEWGLGSAIISILWFGYRYIDINWMFYLFLIITEIVIAISLISNKSYFLPSIQAPSNLKVKAPISYKENGADNKNDDDSYNTFLMRLNTLINSENKSFFGNSHSNEIRKLIKDLCPNKESSLYLLKVYQDIYSADLLTDLQNLTTNYSSIADYLEVFIEHNIISKQYPHNRLC
jgi:hypothetical protein